MTTIKTPPFRAAFPSLFQAQEYEGRSTYGLEAVFPPDADLSKLKKIAAETAKQKWGDSIPKNLKSPFIKGDEYNENRDNPRQELEGCVFMRLRTTVKPEIVDLERKPITDESEIYSGCWMRATAYCHAYDRPGSKGITFLLNNVQKLKDDEPWGAQRKSAFDDFDDNVSKSSEAQEEFSNDW